MIKKKLTLALLIVLAAVSITQANAISDTDYDVRSLTNFVSYFPQGHSIMFQLDTLDYNIVAFNPTNGTLNGSACTFWMSHRFGGSYTFTAQENCTLQLTESVGAVRYDGEGYGSGANFTITAGETYTFEWSYILQPILPFSLILGIIGLAMVLGGSLYGIHSIRQHEYKTALITCGIITLIGVALLVGWFY